MDDMTEQATENEQGTDQRVLVVTPAGMAVEGPPEDGTDEQSITQMVEQPARVMRLGSMIKQLLDGVKSAPLDEASRARLAQTPQPTIKELEQGPAPELVEELNRLSLPF